MLHWKGFKSDMYSAIHICCQIPDPVRPSQRFYFGTVATRSKTKPLHDNTMTTPAARYVPPKGKRAIYYHTSWSNYDRNYQVKDLPIDYISDIAYAFFNVKPDGTVATGDAWADFDNPLIGKGVEPQNTWDSGKDCLGNLGQFSKLRKQGKKFNFALAIGGWTWSANFSDAVSTSATRAKLVQSVVDLFKAWPGLFNGVSLDWEYLSNDGKNYGLDGNKATAQDAENFIELLKLLRSTLGSDYYLSFCVSAAPEKIKMPVDRLHPLLDEIHVMTYDFHDGSWGETVAGHQTNLKKSPYGIYSVEEGITAWQKLGVPSTKLFVGAALYSRGFNNTDGLGKTASGGSPDKSWDAGSVDYKALPVAGAVEMWDDVAKAGYSYDAKRRVLNSYDTVRSVIEKCKYVNDNNLGGILVWESSGDAPFTSDRSIMRAIAQNLTHGNRLPPPTPTSPTAAPTPGPTPARPVPSTPVPSSTTTPTSTPATVKNWTTATAYKVGDIVLQQGTQYKCIQPHTAQAGWEPSIVRALWEPISK